MGINSLVGFWADDSGPIGNSFKIGSSYSGTVPIGAKYLYFGFQDIGGWGDNGGTVTATYNIAP